MSKDKVENSKLILELLERSKKEMNSTQMACLQKLINTLQECEGNGLTFSYASLLINVEDEESHYLEYLSAQKLFELLDFIDGCGDVKCDDPFPDGLNNLQTPEVYIGYDDGSRVGDHTAYVEFKNNVLKNTISQGSFVLA